MTVQFLMQSTGENPVLLASWVRYFVEWVCTESILSSLMSFDYSWKLSVIKNIVNMFW